MLQPDRKTIEEEFMAEALAAANIAFDKGEIPVGAVIVYKDEIIARSHNLVESLNDPSAHAEVLAIREAASKLGNWRLNDCQLYVTLEPCPMCIGASILARIKEVYFGAYEQRLGAVGSQFNLAQHPELPHQIKVTPELLAEQSTQLLQKFFSEKR